MRNYATFLSKRILCNKSNIWAMFVIVAIVTIYLIMNIRSQEGFREEVKSQIQTEGAYSADDIEGVEARKQSYERLLAYYDQKNWSMFYMEYEAILQNQKQVIENTISISGGEDPSTHAMSSDIDKKISYITYLKKYNLAYENFDFPIFGLSFTTHILQLILPTIITLYCIYILAQIFVMDYVKEVDISYLFPLGKWKVFLTKMTVGIMFTIFINIAIIVLTFLISSLLSGNTGLSYPIMIQNVAGAWNAIKASTFLKEWLVLVIFFYINLSFFMYILSIFIRDAGHLIFIAICIVLGMSFLPMIVDYIKVFAHLIPTTYMNYVSVATGDLLHRYHNMHITTITGMKVLSITALLQIVICMIYMKCRSTLR